MTHFTSFAVAGGTGMVGRAIVDGLLAANATRVVVLSRSADSRVAAEAEVKAVDFDSLEEVQNAISGIDVVICTLRDTQATQEPLLAHACQAAGTKLFLPSEFGSHLDGLQPGQVLHHKIDIRDAVRALGLPSLRVVCGVWYETTFLPNRFGFDFTSGKVEVVGTGNEPWSFTSVTDVGAWVGALLVARPAEELVSVGIVAFEGDCKTLNEVLAIWESLHPDRKLEVVRTSHADSLAFESRCEGFNYFTRALVNEWAQPGPGSADATLGGQVSLSTELVPGWKPQRVRDYLAQLADADSIEPGWRFYEA